jgi:hypothetical protein
MIVYNTDATTGVGIYVWDGKDWIKPCAPPAPGPITFSGTTICGSTFTAKIDSVKGATSYVWTLPEGLSGSSNDTIITINGIGTYPADSITVRAVSSCGAGTRRASTQALVVYETPAEPTNPSSATISSGQSFTFSASVPTGHVIDWYTTDTGGSPISGKIGISSFAETLTSTKTYFAESRNLTTGCVSTSRLPVTGTVKIYATCITSSLDLTGKVAFVSTTETTTASGLVFSAPVKITASKTAFDGGSDPNFKADYRDHSADTDTYGSWFSWCMVMQYEDVLCPGTWRVPTRDEFVAYRNAEGSTVKSGMHGWLMGGYTDPNSTLWGVGETGTYWSSTGINAVRCYFAHIYEDFFEPQDYTDRGNGFSLRCVR